MGVVLLNQSERDYMTETQGNEPGSALFARIRQMVNERGVDIRQTLDGNALRLEFADGQRIVINIDVKTQNVWLAASSGGIELIHHDGAWRAHDQAELFARLRELIEQGIASNPLNARAPQQFARPTPSIYHVEKKSLRLRNLLIVLLAAMLGFWLTFRVTQPIEPFDDDTDGQPQTVAFSKSGPSRQCEGGYPANGNITAFPGSGLRTNVPNDPEITLNNDHAHPLLLILTAPQTAIPSLSVLIHAKQSTSFHLPAGQYDMMFSTGNTWCNPRIGFSDGSILKFNKLLTVQIDKPMQLAMQSSGTGAADFQLFIKTANPETALPQPTFTGDGSMEVQRHANGHFYLPGTVENVPVTFMVDTGASVTAISSELAREAGIRNCKEVQFHTANGTANGCIALVQHMTLGNFVLQNITVAVMPNMEVNLLGANVLRNFQTNQSDSTMLIGRK
jgi:aspartyl protease family protein